MRISIIELEIYRYLSIAKPSNGMTRIAKKYKRFPESKYIKNVELKTLAVWFKLQCDLYVLSVYRQ